MRFRIEFVLPTRGGVIARQLDPGEFDASSGALLGEHVVLSVQVPRALDEKGEQRKDLFAFRLDLDPDHPEPKPGDVLEFEKLDL